MNKKIALVGFSGSGKSTIARHLAEKLNVSWVDTDQLVEQNAGRSITSIIGEDGEAAFRKLETSALKEALSSDAKVIATGGGILLREENAKALFEQATLVHLKVDADEAFERIKKDEDSSQTIVRPLLAKPNAKDAIIKLMDERKALYAKANVEVDTNAKSPNEVVEEILKKVGV